MVCTLQDKEYPVKSLRIADLQKQIEELKVTKRNNDNQVKQVKTKAQKKDC